MASEEKTSPKKTAPRKGTAAAKTPATASTAAKKASAKTPAATKKAPAASRKVKAKAAPAAKSAAVAKVLPLREEATNIVSKIKATAREAAATGKEKTVSTLDDVTAMVEDIARAIDEKAGPQYGSYAHRAAGAISGLSETLKTKQLDEMLEDARDFVKRRPAVAIGTAAAIGFALTRLFRADTDEQGDA